MRLRTKLVLLALAGGSLATVLVFATLGALYLWPVPTAGELCDVDICFREGEIYGSMVWDI